MVFADDGISRLFNDFPGYTFILIVVGTLIGLLIGWLIIRQVATYFAQAAIQTSAPSSLILTLSFLTLVSVVGALVTTQESAWTLAATGMGALAASLTSYFQLSRERIMSQEEQRSMGMNWEREKPALDDTQEFDPIAPNKGTEVEPEVDASGLDRPYDEPRDDDDRRA